MKSKYYVFRVDFVVKASTAKQAELKLRSRLRSTLEIRASEPKLIQARNGA